jgi:hypothetical protein
VRERTSCHSPATVPTLETEHFLRPVAHVWEPRSLEGLDPEQMERQSPKEVLNRRQMGTAKPKKGPDHMQIAHNPQIPAQATSKPPSMGLA